MRRIPLFKLFGFEVRLDLSWLFIGALITWSLAKGFFPQRFADLSSETYWWMGLAATLGIFASIVFHELCHSLVARRFGLEIKGITLFIFGGVAEMEGEPRSAVAEFTMALAGPLSSVVLALALYGGRVVGRWFDLPLPVWGVLSYLSYMNFLLAGFNLIPAYPLDGGRVLRSILWKWKRDLVWATRIASRIGSAFGSFLIILGLWYMLTGHLFNGFWWLLIGSFLRTASQSSYRQVITRQALEGTQVRRFMRTDPVTVPPSLTLDRLVEEFLLRHHHKLYPVTDEGRLVGCITTQQVSLVPREEWPRRTVGELASGCNADNTIIPDLDAMAALARMNRTGKSRLMVVEGGKLVGIITLKDIMGYLAVKLELERREAV